MEEQDGVAGADVVVVRVEVTGAGAQGDLGVGGGHRGGGDRIRTHQTNLAVTEPSPANVAVTTSPAATGTIAQTAPGRMT